MIGQGVVGLIVTALLSSYPLSSVISLDILPWRRSLSLSSGARLSLPPPNNEREREYIRQELGDEREGDESMEGHTDTRTTPCQGADIVIETSGITLLYYFFTSPVHKRRQLLKH